MKTISLCLLLALFNSLASQSTLFLDSISRKPIPAVRVYCANQVFYSNTHGEILGEPEKSRSAYALHPDYQTHRVNWRDTNYLKARNRVLLPPLTIRAKAEHKNKTINPRNTSWRLSHVAIPNGSIHGIALGDSKSMQIEYLNLYFKTAIITDIAVRVWVYDAGDTLAKIPSPIAGHSSFDTLKAGHKQYQIPLNSSTLYWDPDMSPVLCVEFKYDKQSWGNSQPQLEYWKSQTSNYYYLHEGYKLSKTKPMARGNIGPTTIGISVSGYSLSW